MSRTFAGPSTTRREDPENDSIRGTNERAHHSVQGGEAPTPLLSVGSPSPSPEGPSVYATRQLAFFRRGRVRPRSKFQV